MVAMTCILPQHLRPCRLARCRRPNALNLCGCRAFVCWVSLTMTYFHEGRPHYHRRMCVSRSCSGREGVVPHSYGRQTLTCCLRCWQAKGGRSVLCDCLDCVFWHPESRVRFVLKVIGSSHTGN